jgi:hypothetical protein
MSYLTKAIKILKPTAEFSFTDEDYSTINWDVLEGNPPTKKQIDDAIEQVKANEITKAAANVQAKSALLERLGISEDEAKLLLS